MQSEPTPSFYPYLCQRFRSLIWACLDSDLTKSAVFHAERYFAMDRTNHEARHLYATALLREGQTYSAMHLVNGPLDEQCTGCLEIKSKCCSVLGRHRQARDALEATLRDTTYVSSGPFIVLCSVASIFFAHLLYFVSVIKQQDIETVSRRSCVALSIRQHCVERQSSGEGVS
jgi:hypothetical protein